MCSDFVNPLIVVKTDDFVKEMRMSVKLPTSFLEIVDDMYVADGQTSYGEVEAQCRSFRCGVGIGRAAIALIKLTDEWLE